MSFFLKQNLFLPHPNILRLSCFHLLLFFPLPSSGFVCVGLGIWFSHGTNPLWTSWFFCRLVAILFEFNLSLVSCLRYRDRAKVHLFKTGHMLIILFFNSVSNSSIRLLNNSLGQACEISLSRYIPPSFDASSYLPLSPMISFLGSCLSLSIFRLILMPWFSPVSSPIIPAHLTHWSAVFPFAMFLKIMASLMSPPLPRFPYWEFSPPPNCFRQPPYLRYSFPFSMTPPPTSQIYRRIQEQRLPLD